MRRGLPHDSAQVYACVRACLNNFSSAVQNSQWLNSASAFAHTDPSKLRSELARSCGECNAKCKSTTAVQRARIAALISSISLEMQGSKTVHAGGAWKNRQVDVV